MPSTYTVNLGIEKPATGEQSGTWGDTTNTNFDILDQGINGAVRITLTSAGSSGSPNALTITNGAASNGRNKWIEFYSSGDLGGNVFVQLDPNDAEKIVFVRNSLAGSRTVLLFQGTYNSGRDLEVPAGVDMVVKFDGGGASAATVTNVYNNLKVTGLVAGTADINGGTIDGTVIGGAAAAALTATTVVASTSLNIASDGATVTGIKDEDNMSSNSATKLATQQSIKAYVDSQVGTVDTLAEILANGNDTGSNNIDVDGAQKVQFRDSAIFINSSTNGQLDIVADNEIQIAATTIDINGAIVASGDISAASLDISGNVDIDGILNVDAIDIDGAVQLDATLTVGVDDTGYDVKFFGAAGGSFLLWDESANNLSLAGASTLNVAGVVTANAGIVVDSIAIDGNAIDCISGDLELDVAGDIILDADGGDFKFRDGGAGFFTISNSSLDTVLKVEQSNQDFIIKGNDGGNEITALTLDMSDFGSAIFTAAVDITGVLSAKGGAVFNENSADVDFRIESDNLASAFFLDGGTGKVTMQGATTAIGSAASSTNVEFNLNGIAGKAQRIQFQENTVNRWLLGQGAASETTAFELFNSAGQIALSVNRGTNVATFIAPVISPSFVSTAGGTFTTASGNDLNIVYPDGRSLFFKEAGTTTLSLDNTQGATFAGTIAAGAATFTTADNSANLTLVSTDADASAGPLLVLDRNSASPADGDVIGEIQFNGKNDAAEAHGYAKIEARIVDASNATEDGRLEIATSLAGEQGISRILMTNIETVVNDNSKDIDFRVESNDQSEMLLINAGTNLVGIKGNPAGANGVLQVTGSIGTTGNAEIRQSTNSDGSTLRFLGTQFVAAAINSNSYSYSGGGLVASVSPSNAAITLDAGAVSTSGHRLKVVNGGNGVAGFLQYLDGANNRFSVNSSSGEITVGNSTQAVTMVQLNHENSGGKGELQLNAHGTASFSMISNFTGSTVNGVATGGFGLVTPHNASIVINTSGLERIKAESAGNVVINEGGANADFRVESDVNANALFLDAGTDVISVGYSSQNGAFVDKASTGLQLGTPGVDNNGGHMFMSQTANTDEYMDIIATHDDGATGVYFSIHAVRTGDQNRSYAATIRYAYNDTFNVMTSNSQNFAIDYRVSGNVLQYRITSPGPYFVNLTVMAAG